MRPALFLALALTAAPGVGHAAIMGTGPCEGLGVHAAWLDWGTGIVSVAVFNHTGDGRWPPRPIRFQLGYKHDGKIDAGGTRTLAPLRPVNVELFNYKTEVGDDFSGFQGEDLLQSGEIVFVECATGR